MDIKGRLQQLMDDRGWTIYRLAKESGVPWSTVRNMFKRDTDPSLFTLEAICRGLGITLFQFFDIDSYNKTPEKEKELISNWKQLSHAEQELILSLTRALIQKDNYHS